MKLQTFVFNPFYENTYVLSDDNGACMIIDPGCYEPYEIDELVSYIDGNKLQPQAIINTHCHIDHILGNAELKAKYQIPLWVPSAEKVVLDAAVAYSTNWGITGYQPATPDKLYVEDDLIPVGNLRYRFIFSPGHSPGHMMLYFDREKTLIAGDVIFDNSIGRTDLPGGDFPTLEKTIKEKVYTLADDTEIYPGHGPKTTVGKEKKTNPFVTV